jgi:hypothetical protein
MPAGITIPGITLAGLGLLVGCPATPADPPVSAADAGSDRAAAARGGGGSSGQAGGETVTIRGVIEGEEDGTGIAGMSVTLDGGAPSTTGKDGGFALDVPLDQDVSLRFEKSGYLPLAYPLRLASTGSPPASLVAFPLSTEFVAGIRGAAGGEGAESELTAVLVDLDGLSAAGGESVTLTASHGETFVMADSDPPRPGNTLPAIGPGESADVLFLDVVPGLTGIEVTSPTGRCALSMVSPPADAVPVTRGAVTFVYVECSASARMNREAEEAAGESGVTSGSTRSEP